MSFNATFVTKKNQPWISPLRKIRGKFKNKVIWFTTESRAESRKRTYYVQGCACLSTGGSCVVVRKGRPSREDLCHSHTQGSNNQQGDPQLPDLKPVLFPRRFSLDTVYLGLF